MPPPCWQYITLSRGARILADTKFEALKQEHKDDFDAVVRCFELPPTFIVEADLLIRCPIHVDHSRRRERRGAIEQRQGRAEAHRVVPRGTSALSVYDDSLLVAQGLTNQLAVPHPVGQTGRYDLRWYVLPPYTANRRKTT